MKTILLAISLLLAVTGVQGAVQYEFRQTFRSDVETMPPNDMTGRAVIDGDRYRVEFLSGTAFPPGSYMFTTNGSKQQIWIDPTKKSYVEVNAAGVANALGASRITISNKKIDVTAMQDHPTIAGLPTDHYRMVMSYDIAVPFGQLQLKQSVTTLIDKWTTMAYAGAADGFLADGGIRTGNPDIDDLVAAENTKIKGFPLRQTIEVTTVNATPRNAGSQIPLKQVHTQTKDMTITAIESKPEVAATLFQIPAGFHKADPLRDDTQKAPVHVLSMEPEKQ
ncbi:MAG TPA: hypothetical protein VJZ76_03340 [Thermoanaerobaculia bacterium]|nr:hypothetical protein [Thermoanaerobaculia bacterium]